MKNDAPKKRIGVLGGSFDPVHTGHLILAEQIRIAAGLRKVLLVPARISPFKLDSEPASGEDRLAMLRLAIEGNPGLEAEDLELHREGPSYTYDTLCELAERYKDTAELCFIAGADSLFSIEKWYRAEDLLKRFPVIIGTREGLEEDRAATDAKIEDLKCRFGADICYAEIPELEVSSSDVRKRYADGQSVRYMVPDSVLNYMYEHRLYRDLPGVLRRRAEQSEKATRFEHTKGVVQCIAELASRYGCDPYKAEAAAWAHDLVRPAGNLEHGFLAAEILQKDFNIFDEDLLNAVRYHTTGRPGMSLLEKVLKIADNIEPNRSYPGVDEIRACVTDDPDESLLYIMKHTRDYVNSIGGTYVQISQDAIADLELIVERKSGKESND